jgi:hypothetical protein
MTSFGINGLAFPAARWRALPAGALPRGKDLCRANGYGSRKHRGDAAVDHQVVRGDVAASRAPTAPRATPRTWSGARDAQCPMGHMGEGRDPAYACLFFASEEAKLRKPNEPNE